MWLVWFVWYGFLYTVATIVIAALSIPVALGILLLTASVGWFLFTIALTLYRILRGLYYVKIKKTLPPEYLVTPESTPEQINK